MKENVEALSSAINKMKFKLLLMEQYYIRMRQDYEIFVDFIGDQKSEYETMKAGINGHLSGLASYLKTQKKRDVFSGNEHRGDDYKQKLDVETEFDETVISTEETQVQIGTRTTKGNYAAEGAAIGGIVGGVAGGIAGGIAGGCAAGPAGAVVGAIGGAGGGAAVGAFIGACIGSLISKKTKTPIYGEEKKLVRSTRKRKIWMDVDQQVYNGEDHARALQEIRDAMKTTIQGYIEDLESKEESASKKVEEIVKMEANIKGMIEKANNFKSNIDCLKQILSSDKGISTSQKDRLDKKWNDTKGKVEQFLKSIKPMKEINEAAK